MSTGSSSGVPVEQVDGIEGLGGIFVELEEQFKNADYREPLTEFQADQQANESSMFSGRKGPDGSPWAPNAPATIAKKGHDITLVETGALRASLVGVTGESIREVTHRGSIFGTSNERSLWNQEGSTHVPARPHVGMDEQLTDRLANVIADSTVEQLKFKA